MDDGKLFFQRGQVRPARERERDRERESVCVCVCVRERESARELLMYPGTGERTTKGSDRDLNPDP